MNKSIVAVLILVVVASMVCADTVYYRTDDGSWQQMEATATGETVKIMITPDAAPGGKATLVVNKPQWMVLDDDTPPQITGMKVDGKTVAVADVLDFGGFGAEVADIELAIADDSNPISPQVAFSLSDSRGADIEVDATGLGEPAKSGNLIIHLAGLGAGRYTGNLTIRDMAPLSNERTWPIAFGVMGISIADDLQKVSISNGTAGYEMKSGDIANQLLLPTGQWAKLTTNIPGNFTYPRQFTDVEIVEDTPEQKTVLVYANAQTLKNEPIEDMVEFEYELTVRADTPAIVVTSRSFNISDKVQSFAPNWGWLGAPYYATADGRQEWHSDAANKYYTIGNVNWVWLAPRKTDEPGLLWVSRDKFGEFTGGSILTYGESGQLEVDEAAEMRMIFAPAADIDEAQSIYADIVAKGLYTPNE